MICLPFRKCQNFTLLNMPFDHLLAASILISVNFSEKKKFRPSVQDLRFSFASIFHFVSGCNMITEHPHFCTMDVDIEYAF